MSRRLPPLNSLRAFEAAARHLSLKKAAEELHVTPAAVSHQIRTLEEYCGTPLFHRLARALRLAASGSSTPSIPRSGTAIAPSVSSAFTTGLRSSYRRRTANTAITSSRFWSGTA